MGCMLREVSCHIFREQAERVQVGQIVALE